MRRLTKHIGRRHDGRMLMTAAHATHPRCCDVMPADAADILEPMLPEPFASVLTLDEGDADDVHAWDSDHWLSTDDILHVRDRHRWHAED